MLSCVKYLVIIYNLLFWLIGVGILGFSVYLYVDTQTYIHLENAAELINTPFFVIMALGAIMTLVGFLGCCGAIRESSCLLGMYIFFCVTMGVACGAAVWWSKQNETFVKDRLQQDYQTIIKDKYTNGGRGAIEILVDKVQKDFQCCGARGLEDWSNSKFQQGNHTRFIEFGVSAEQSGKNFEVPSSCCMLKHPDCERNRKTAKIGAQNEGLNSEGCIKKISGFIDEKWQLLIMIGSVVVVIQVIALLLTCCFCCALSRDDK